MAVAPGPGPAAARVEERPDGALHVHPGWAASLPWLVQGITAGGDMTLFGDSPAGEVVGRWLRLRDGLGARSIVHSRQVHGSVIRSHAGVPAGLVLAPDGDGHATAEPGLLLAVSVADCVPISIVAPAARAIALLHGGWRGVAAGILERGVELLLASCDAGVGDMHVHLGPAICGSCYEVGPEVTSALGLPPAEDGDGRVLLDLRAVLAQRAVAAGLREEHLSMSSFCTRCGNSPFYSHRAGCRERQIAVLGIRDDG